MHDGPADASAGRKPHIIPTVETSHAPFFDHVGAPVKKEATMNMTQVKPRGYGIGGLFSKWEDGDKSYKQRSSLEQPDFKGTNAEGAFKAKDPARDLDKL